MQRIINLISSLKVRILQPISGVFHNNHLFDITWINRSSSNSKDNWIRTLTSWVAQDRCQPLLYQTWSPRQTMWPTLPVHPWTTQCSSSNPLQVDCLWRFISQLCLTSSTTVNKHTVSRLESLEKYQRVKPSTPTSCQVQQVHHCEWQHRLNRCEPLVQIKDEPTAFTN